jgi:flagellar basal-body rod protein FlgG
MPVSYEIDTLASGMIANQDRHNVIANNIANVNSTGFKKDVPVERSFATVLSGVQKKGMRSSLNDNIYHSEVLVDVPVMTHEIQTAHEQGDMRVSGNPLDLAIMGKGFFSVQGAQGEVLTRNGNFMLNSNNELVTLRGERVLGEGGDGGASIVINGTNATFQEDGTVQVDGLTVGRLKMVDVNDYTKLVKTGHGQFRYGGDAADVHPADVSIAQGYLESSNVNSITEMTRMLANTRQYELAGREMKSVEQTYNRAIVELGKFR